MPPAYCIELSDVLSEAKSLSDWVVAQRRHLHSIPELCFNEVKTSGYLRQKLDELGIEYDYPVAGTGIKAFIGMAKDGQPTVALRSDIDALPIQEEVDVEWRSKHAGVMHACGHDAHMAMLLGAAKLLKAREAALPGRVVLVFQPAEESQGGAMRMIAEGVLDGVDAIAGLHVWPALRSGVVGTRAGVIMAASDRFTVTIHGKGGHGAMPHLSRDPVVAAAAVVMALQPLVSRETSPTDGAVVTVSRFNTGPGAFNVIPESVVLQGTVRALTTETFARLHQRIEAVVASTAATYGCTASNVTWSTTPYPPTKNDAGLAAMVSDVAQRMLGPERIVSLQEPSMAAEDFSFYSLKIPAVFSVLGIGGDDPASAPGLHNPKFELDESALHIGSALHAAMALQYLHTASSGAAASAAGNSGGGKAVGSEGGSRSESAEGAKDEL